MTNLRALFSSAWFPFLVGVGLLASDEATG